MRSRATRQTTRCSWVRRRQARQQLSRHLAVRANVKREGDAGRREDAGQQQALAAFRDVDGERLDAADDPIAQPPGADPVGSAVARSVHVDGGAGGEATLVEERRFRGDRDDIFEAGCEGDIER